MVSVLHCTAFFGIIWLIRGTTSQYNKSLNGGREQSIQNSDLNNTREGDFYFEEQRMNGDNVLIGRKIHKTAWSEENKYHNESQSENTKKDAVPNEEWNITNLLKYILSLVYKNEETKEIPPDINHEKLGKARETTKSRHSKEDIKSERNNINKKSNDIQKNSRQKYQNQKPMSNYLNTYYQSKDIKWIDSETDDEYSESSSDSAEEDDDMFYKYEDSNFEKQEKTLPYSTTTEDINSFSNSNVGTKDHIKENKNLLKFQCCKNKATKYPIEKRTEKVTLSPIKKKETTENDRKRYRDTKNNDNFHRDTNDEKKGGKGESGQTSKKGKCVKKKNEDSRDNKDEKITVIPNKNPKDETNNVNYEILSHTTKFPKYTESHSNPQNENISETHSQKSAKNLNSDNLKEVTSTIFNYVVTPSPLSYDVLEKTSKIPDGTKSHNEDETQVESPVTTQNTIEDYNSNDKYLGSKNQLNGSILPSNETTYEEKEDNNYSTYEKDRQPQRSGIKPAENPNRTTEPNAFTSSEFVSISSSSNLNDNVISTPAPRKSNEEYQSSGFKSNSELSKTNNMMSDDATTPKTRIQDEKPERQQKYLQTSNGYSKFQSTVAYTASENLKGANSLGKKSSNDLNIEQEEGNEKNEMEDSNNPVEINSNNGEEYSELQHGNPNPEFEMNEEQNIYYGIASDNRGNNDHIQNETNDLDLHTLFLGEPDYGFQNQENEMSNEIPEENMGEKDNGMYTSNPLEMNFEDEYYDYIKSSNEFIIHPQSGKNLTEHSIFKKSHSNTEIDPKNTARDSTGSTQFPSVNENYKEQGGNYKESPDEFTKAHELFFKQVGDNGANENGGNDETEFENAEASLQLIQQTKSEPKSQEQFGTILEYLYKYSNNSFIRSLKNQSSDSLK